MQKTIEMQSARKGGREGRQEGAVALQSKAKKMNSREREEGKGGIERD